MDALKHLRVLAPLLVWVVVPGAAGRQSSPPASSGATSSEPASHVILSRSLADTRAEPAATVRPPPKEPVTDAQRRDITFLSYDFEIHLQPAKQSIAVRARMILRNDGAHPLRRLPLQISSSLEWSGIDARDKPTAFAEELVPSDADHTGRLREAVITLAQPLAPKQSIAVDATYQGTIARSSRRLEEIGTPKEIAENSDWDRIDGDFVGLRGFGNVVWYPVVSVPVALGDGNKFFSEVAGQRWGQRDAAVSMRITEEFLSSPPTLAVLDGHPLAMTAVSLSQSATLPGIATASLPRTRLGFSTPSLFTLSGVVRGGDGLRIFVRPGDEANAQAYLTAATMVTPLITKWLGGVPRRALTIVDLPEPDDAPYEDGATLFTYIQSAEPDKLTGVMAHALAHSHFESPYPWLNEGVANFMGTLWLEQTSGRETAIARMDNERGALALAEPGDPAAGNADAGESLIAARDPIYYRTKATYVFWMLRDLAGDDALGKAFRGYNPAEDVDGTEFERLLEQAGSKDLKWFFADWVYHDRGLPDLSIAGVYPTSSSLPGSYIVAVTVANSGDAAAEAPVSIRSESAAVTARLRVPARSRITHRFLLAGEPVEVAVNDGSIPEVEASVHRRTISGQP